MEENPDVVLLFQFLDFQTKIQHQYFYLQQLLHEH